MTRRPPQLDLASVCKKSLNRLLNTKKGGAASPPICGLKCVCVCVCVCVFEINNMYPSTKRALFSSYRLCSAIS